MNSIFAYLFSWISTLACPILISIGFVYKKYFLIIFAFLLSFFVYSITAGKASLVLPFLMTFLYYILKSKNIKLNNFIFMFSFLMILGFFSDFFLSIFIRRVLMIPGILQEYQN